MKRLAPAPEADDLVLQIDEPKAGDAAGSVEAVSEAAEALGFSWIEVSDAVWRTEDATLETDKAYYLDATLVLTGRSLPDSFSAKLNDREFEHRAVRYENGRIFVSGAWLFTFGEVPDTAAVHFDTGGICPAPADMEVPVNTAFGSLADAPCDPGLVKEEGACWSLRFDGWFDGEGTPWDELYTLVDMTVHAKWSMLIDEIELTYEIPRKGDSGSALFRLHAPEGVPFEIGQRSLCSEDCKYNHYYYPEDPEEVVLEEGVERWVLGFWIHALSAEVDFLTEGEGYDSVYLGTLTVNGETVDAEAILYNPSWYDESEDKIVPACVKVDFIFTLRGAADEPQVPEEPGEPGKSEASIPLPYLGFPFGFGGNGPFLTYDQLLALRELREKQDRPAAEPDRTPSDDSSAGEKIDLTHEEPEECRDLPVFEDVPADAYFAPAAAWAADNGITTGTDGTHFSPDAFCTRAEAVTFLWRLAGSPVSGGFDLPFADIPEGAYYADAVLWASLAGIVRGTDPAHFSPDGIVTRAQCVTLLYRLMGEKQEGDSPFSDVPEDAWYRDAVLWAVSADVTRGKTEVLFAPEDACTRAQIVTFLYRVSERS
ncbi:MAG: S-layer homology domain-containing protein, partial [Clostridia bacterium]|nr:S-layer homology domain-containing protein [Clostridia bacterium]